MTTITRQPMDACPCGKAVEKFTLKNAQGAYVEISSLGGTIMSIHVPDKDGKLGDVTLGYNTTDTIIHGTGYMGKLIGRQGRIAKEIRTVVRSYAQRTGVKVSVDIVD